jgi:flagellar hook assembly protein FlgD
LDYVWAYTWEQASTSDDPSLPNLPTISVSAYPQPFTGSLNLAVKSDDNSPVRVDIYNLKGQKLKSYISPPNLNIVWDGSDEHGKQCSSGIYLIKAKQNNRSHTTRVIRIK